MSSYGNKPSKPQNTIDKPGGISQMFLSSFANPDAGLLVGQTGTVRSIWRTLGWKTESRPTSCIIWLQCSMPVLFINQPLLDDVEIEFNIIIHGLQLWLAAELCKLGGGKSKAIFASGSLYMHPLPDAAVTLWEPAFFCAAFVPFSTEYRKGDLVIIDLPAQLQNLNSGFFPQRATHSNA